MSEILNHLSWIVPSVITLVMGAVGVIVGRLVTLSVLSNEMRHISEDISELRQDNKDATEDRRRLWVALDNHNGLINRVMGRLGMNGIQTRAEETGD
ncbi:MAG: hypothetical protein KJ954_13890 [Alphaproteobacteria bacterium]|nr:hypothetical protein [Alphaproteobacteria bacterium]